MKREIIKIDEDKCTGCGVCIPACPEGALQIIDNKARLVSDLMCDGLGACIGECPEGAIEIEEREAAPYDEIAVIKEIIKQGENTVIAHLVHLKEHGEVGFMKEALGYLHDHQDDYEFSLADVKSKVHHHNLGCASGGCPGSAVVEINKISNETHVSTEQKHESTATDQPSELRQWPVQMHLINPNAAYFANADVLLAADCSAFTMGDFHSKLLKGKSLVIACPKLDQGTDVYISKLTSLIDEAKINTLQVIIMEVPCCAGLLQMAQQALNQSNRKIPIKKTMISIRGEVLQEEWI